MRARAMLLSPFSACARSADPRARATGFTDIGQDIVPRDKVDVAARRLPARCAETMLRQPRSRSRPHAVRAAVLSGVAQRSERAGPHVRRHAPSHGPRRLFADGGGVAVKMRADIARQPAARRRVRRGSPAASTTQTSPVNAFVVKRAYGEALTPIGLLAAGRMGNAWGLGILANGGDCADCDSGDAADRIAFITPVLDHIVAAGVRLHRDGPVRAGGNGTHVRRHRADRQPCTPSRSPSSTSRTSWRAGGAGAPGRPRSSTARTSRTAGRTTTSPRPTSRHGARPDHRRAGDGCAATHATAMDGWGRLTLPAGARRGGGRRTRRERRAAVADPGRALPRADHVEAAGAGARERVRRAGRAVYGRGFDAGYASGDTAPGFGAFPKVGGPPAAAGRPQRREANPPYDTHVNNFRFHPDYRIDRILFREIIGNVANCRLPAAARARGRSTAAPRASLTASVAGIASWAAVGSRRPGGQSPLGVEIDPTLAYVEPRRLPHRARLRRPLPARRDSTTPSAHLDAHARPARPRSPHVLVLKPCAPTPSSTLATLAPRRPRSRARGVRRQPHAPRRRRRVRRGDRDAAPVRAEPRRNDHGRRAARGATGSR